MLYMLGALRIDTWPFNVKDVQQTGATDYAIKPVVGAEQPLEFVGEGANEFTLEGSLWPSERGGAAALGGLELLTQMRVSGRPQYLMRGDGRPFGWYSILSVGAKSSYLGPDGVGKQVGVTINLRRAPKPSAQSFFSLMMRLIG